MEIDKLTAREIEIINLCSKLRKESIVESRDDYTDDEITKMFHHLEKFPSFEYGEQLSNIERLLIGSDPDEFIMKGLNKCTMIDDNGNEEEYEFNSIWKMIELHDYITDINNITDKQAKGLKLSQIMYAKIIPYMDDYHHLSRSISFASKPFCCIDEGGNRAKCEPYIYQLINDIREFEEFCLFFSSSIQPMIRSIDALNPTQQACADHITSPIHLSKKKGTKTDFVRIINAMFELGMFTDKNECQSSKIDVFKALGDAVNIDLSNYANILSMSKKSNNMDGNNQQVRIFDQLKEANTNKSRN